MSKGNKDIIKGNKRDLKAVIWPFSQTHQDQISNRCWHNLSFINSFYTYRVLRFPKKVIQVCLYCLHSNALIFFINLPCCSLNSLYLVLVPLAVAFYMCEGLL